MLCSKTLGIAKHEGDRTQYRSELVPPRVTVPIRSSSLSFSKIRPPFRNKEHLNVYRFVFCLHFSFFLSLFFPGFFPLFSFTPGTELPSRGLCLVRVVSHSGVGPSDHRPGLPLGCPYMSRICSFHFLVGCNGKHKLINKDEAFTCPSLSLFSLFLSPSICTGALTRVCSSLQAGVPRQLRG